MKKQYHDSTGRFQTVEGPDAAERAEKCDELSRRIAARTDIDDDCRTMSTPNEIAYGQAMDAWAANEESRAHARGNAPLYRLPSGQVMRLLPDEAAAHNARLVESQ
jgi:hypothetical protein